MTTSKAQQRQATTAAILSAARTQFARHGYAAVSLAGIVDAVGLTKGALYHHFESKAALFRAVIEQVHGEVADRVATAATAEPDAWRQLIAGCEEFLRACAAPEVRQIMLIDGPAVLGWAQWRILDDTTSARHLREALQALIDAGTLPGQHVEPLTHLLSGAMNETALWLADSDDPRDIDDAVAALSMLLEALRTSR